MNEPMAGVAKHLKGFPWRYGVGRAGSTAVKRSLFNSGVGRNNWLSIQIFDLNRRDLVPSSGSGDPGRNFHEYSLPPFLKLAKLRDIHTNAIKDWATRLRYWISRDGARSSFSSAVRFQDPYSIRSARRRERGAALLGVRALFTATATARSTRRGPSLDLLWENAT